MLDIRTLYFCMTVSSLAASVSLFVFALINDKSRALGLLAVSQLLLLIGGITLALRGYIHDVFSIVVANTCVVFAGLMIGHSVRYFYGRKVQLSSTMILLAGFVSLFLYFTFVEPDFIVRVHLFSLSMIAALLWSARCAYVLSKDKSIAGAGLAMICFVHAAFCAQRYVCLLISDEPVVSIFNPSIHDQLFYMEAIFFALAAPVTFVLMVNERLLKETSNLANEDPLTKLWNRRAFADLGYQQLRRCREAGAKASICMIDIDHFKKINDTYGHEVGDEVIRGLGQILIGELKGNDLSARYGGEEFVLLLPGTDEVTAMQVADRLNDKFKAFLQDRNLQAVQSSLSSGVYCVHDEDALQDAVRVADQCLYRAKRQGRDRVVGELSGVIIDGVHS